MFVLKLLYQDENDWPVIDPLPSYGRGRDTQGGRFSSLIFGTNLTDVIITGKESCSFEITNFVQLRIYSI